MFAYGVCIGRDAKYQAYAHRGITAHAPGARILERRDQSSIFTAYNSILDEARADEHLSALALVHDDTEIRDPDFEGKVLAVMKDPDVAIVGVIGGRGPRSVQWGQCAERFGHAPDPYYGSNDYGRGTADVDVVDGLLLVLSPWAVSNLRFDEQTFSGFHAYDVDLCMQAKHAGKRVVVTDVEVFHHTKGGYGDVDNHRRNDVLFRRKWGLPLDPLRYRLRRRLQGKPY